MIYLDNNATTFLDPKVREEIQSLLTLPLGNSSSIHQAGQKARQLLTDARFRIAHLLSVTPEELCFTSSATEAINLLLSPQKKMRHIISSTLEHTATLSALKRLEKEGSLVTYLDPYQGKGSISLSQIEEAITPETDMLVFMAANNETGIKNDIESIAAFAEKKRIACIVDGVGLFGKEPFSLPKGVTGFCISAHKIHGPKGIALAVVRTGYRLKPLIVGGSQQFNRRGGTEDIVAIRALVTAMEIASERAHETKEHLTQLRDYFETSLQQKIANISIQGMGEARVANVSNIAFKGIDAESLVINLDLAGLCVSHGAACSSGALEHSHVLVHMGLPTEVVRAAIRFSFSRFTTQGEIDKALAIIANVFAIS